MKNYESLYEAPVSRIIGVISFESILTGSQYGDPGKPGNYDSENDEDYGNF